MEENTKNKGGRPKEGNRYTRTDLWLSSLDNYRLESLLTYYRMTKSEFLRWLIRECYKHIPSEN